MSNLLEDVDRRYTRASSESTKTQPPSMSIVKLSWRLTSNVDTAYCILHTAALGTQLSRPTLRDDPCALTYRFMLQNNGLGLTSTNAGSQPCSLLSNT
ncbi:hypothetical protein EMCG_04878 [[Emmonsia] crescens]|uniref:Uncharacterized protein n=1 Tax=[Emmonsia] crescens TaxID=73230 RepID=A0A0G2HRU0_9EURO|nr:hypothetical protein EMCG_04878 [Emmonsia crescens UAMH 3008]